MLHRFVSGAGEHRWATGILRGNLDHGLVDEHGDRVEV